MQAESVLDTRSMFATVKTVVEAVIGDDTNQLTVSSSVYFATILWHVIHFANANWRAASAK